FSDFSLDGKRHYPALPLSAKASNAPVSLLQVRPTLVGVDYKNAPAPKEAQSSRRSPYFESKGFVPHRYYDPAQANQPWPRTEMRENEAASAGTGLWPSHMPSDDMIAEGLQEGMLMPEGFVSGFVYFERVAPKEKQLSFNAKLVDA